MLTTIQHVSIGSTRMYKPTEKKISRYPFSDVFRAHPLVRGSRDGEGRPRRRLELRLRPPEAEALHGQVV